MTGPAATQEDAEAAARRRLAWAWTAAGYGFFALGLLGIALPLLPTVIFWIFAAACFARGCPAMVRRIYAWPGAGPAVEDFLSHGVIARKGKLGALAGMGLAALVVALAPLPAGATWITLGGIAVGALYVVTRPEARPRPTACEAD